MSSAPRTPARRRRPRSPLADLLLAPDRERIPGARATVLVREDDEPALLAAVRRLERARFRLERRGRDHGVLVELDAERLLPPAPRGRRRPVLEEQRWRAAQPLVLSAAVDPAGVAGEAERFLAALDEEGGLARLVAAAAARLGATAAPDARLADPERDLARVRVDGLPEGELWVKSARLSTHPRDRSRRVRVSFGVEGDDDASRDEPRHRRAGELGDLLLPGSARARGAAALVEPLRRLVGAPPLLTQPIAYANAPGGGALLHHDAFDEPREGGQRGVAYVQLGGATVWLALSIEDLAARVREIVGSFDDGGAFAACFPGAELAAARAVARRRAPLLAELALPGQGVLGPVVNAPAATGLFVDAGHAAVLRAGDAILLPNHGLERTAMHSVFAGAPASSYGLSFAVRAAVCQDRPASTP